MKSSVLLVFFVLALSGCGEPLVVLGDLPGVMRVVLGMPALGGTVVDTIATRSRLLGPASVASLPNGDILVVDRTRGVIRVTPAGRATLLYLPPAGCTVATCPIGAEGTATIGEQALIIADNQGNRIWRFDLQSRAMTPIAGSGQFGISPDGTLATAAALSSPTDVAVTADGRIVIAESGANRVRAIGADGRLTTIAGTGEPGRGGDGGPAVRGQLSAPSGLAVSGTSLFISEVANRDVRRVDLQTGTINLVAGAGEQGFGGDGGSALDARLDFPWALEVSPDGALLFIADVGNDRIRVVNLNEGTIATFAGTGAEAYNGNGRAAAETSLSSPFGLAVASQGFLFIADTNHHIVWRTPIQF